MRSLKSSAIDAIHHDGEALIVRFTSGREARYPTADAEHVDAMHAAVADAPAAAGSAPGQLLKVTSRYQG